MWANVVGVRRGGDDVVDATRDGGLREDTVEVHLEDWLVAQLRGDRVALLDWQLQHELSGLAKRLCCKPRRPRPGVRCRGVAR